MSELLESLNLTPSQLKELRSELLLPRPNCKRKGAVLNPIISQLRRMFGDWEGVDPTHDEFGAVMTICDHVNANYTQNERGRFRRNSVVWDSREEAYRATADRLLGCIQSCMEDFGHDR